MVKIAAIAALAIFQTLAIPTVVANATPQICTPAVPYAPYNSVCTGYGQSCYLAFDNCTPVKGVPGTWNPDGYTPCQNQYGC